MSEPITVTHIKQEAIVSVSLGTDIIGRLQGALNYLIEGKEQDILAIREHITAGTPLTPWESATVALSQLIQAIHTSAVESGQVTTKSLEDSITGLVG